MNAVTFNDRIKAVTMMPSTRHPSFSALDSIEKMFPHWETAPLFLYDEPESEAEATAIVKAYQDDVFAAFPFPVFRLDVTVGDKTKPTSWGKYKAKALVSGQPDGAVILARVDQLMHNDITYRFYGNTDDKALPLYMLVHGIRQTARGSADFECHANILIGIGGKWQSEIPEFFRSYINGFLKSLAAFNLSAMSPTNHIVEVTPNQPCRSVEWIKARTHYTLITHGHPANNPGVSHGARVTADPDQELIRMAHNRRAHPRTYRHKRYTYARGKTRWVKACWVGPKEWKDEGGRQIYRILEPVEDVAAGAVAA
jgi:hypothetical protein